MTRLTKQEKILRWAKNKRKRNIAHVIKELDQKEKSFIFMLNRLKRWG